VAFYPEPVARLIDALQRLPGIGPKTAQRLTFFLLKRPTEEVRELSSSLMAVKERIVYCSTCFNVTDQDPCLPVGGDLEYADQVTLTKALEGRREMG
jgi:recombination protein RecR